MACFRCNTTENFIFLLKYRQRNVDLSTSKKLLVFVSIRHTKMSSLHPAIIYEKFIFTQKYALAERCCFLTFSFEGNIRKYDISVKRKHTKTNKNMIISALFTNFRKTKILFFVQWLYCTKPQIWSYMYLVLESITILLRCESLNHCITCTALTLPAMHTIQKEFFDFENAPSECSSLRLI